ncbi:TorF family putative porin [Parerythrobacter aestuarii]|uniref:TorF family putative porin n=1 Tax=Parerythrobacter aestuarii TaxID=3020909 RepID=UPI0024DE92AC|nr:TorF family putative porin [Parerythrobacter aestuarii]
MLTSFRGLTAPLLAGCAFVATPAFAAETAADDSLLSEPSAASVEALPDAAPAAADNVVDPVVDQASIALAAVERDAYIPTDDQANSVGDESGFELSGNVALVSDYRFRGVSFSDGDFALQGGIDLGHSSGFYIGTWASSISGGSPYGELELDVYAGWSGDISDGVTVDVGLLYYIYPTEGELANLLGVETDYFEPYASISTTLGPVGATLGVAYAWDQDSLGGSDNLYIYTDFEAGIPNTPLTLTAHLGYTDGVFATSGSGESFDWGLGISAAVGENLSIGFNYVDTEGPSIEDFTDAGFFVTIGYSM